MTPAQAEATVTILALEELRKTVATEGGGKQFYPDLPTSDFLRAIDSALTTANKTLGAADEAYDPYDDTDADSEARRWLS